MNPYRDRVVLGYVRSFLDKFFSDRRKRILVFGINPGRFGAGITGVTFTDPVALESCGIPNGFPKRRESSSDFVYRFIEAWGGPKKFYRDFFLTAVSPLGFVKKGINFNFYDHPDLLRDTRPFLSRTIWTQIAFGARRDVAIVLGTGKLRKIFEDLNCEQGFFDTVCAVEHPRFIMQYRRRHLGAFIQKYRAVFTKALAAKNR